METMIKDPQDQIRILILGPSFLNRLKESLQTEYKTTLLSERLGLESSIASVDLIVAFSDYRNFEIDILLENSKKKVIYPGFYIDLYTKQKEALLNEIKFSAEEIQKKLDAKIVLSFPKSEELSEKEIVLSSLDIEKILKVAGLLGADKVSFIDKLGNITEIKSNDKSKTDGNREEP